VSLAAFDDSNLDSGAFPSLLRARGEAAWHTWDCAFMRDFDDTRPLGHLERQLAKASQPLLQQLAHSGTAHTRKHALVDQRGRLVFHGGMEDLSRFHTTLVRGGAAWPASMP